MALAVADLVADDQVFGVAAAAFTQRQDVLQCGGFWCDMVAADPARHLAMQLTGHSAVDLDSNMSQTTHGHIFKQKRDFNQIC